MSPNPPSEMHASLDGLLLTTAISTHPTIMQAPIPAGTLRKSGLFVREEKYFHGGGDAQGFRKGNRLNLNVLQTEAWMKQNVPIAEAYDYHLRPSSLARFTGTHPDVMSARIARINWNFRRIRSTKPAFLQNRSSRSCSFQNSARS